MRMADSRIRNNINIFINGVEHSVAGEEAFLPLAQYLRYCASLPGTKVVCAEGDCGACTTIVSRLIDNKWSKPQTINSCIAPLYLFDGCSVVTVEGLEKDQQLSEVQEKMRTFHGGQCGYCTPGMVCSLSSLAEDCSREKKEITEKKARNYLTGNLCRCTGYEPILNAATNLDLSKWESLESRYFTANEATVFNEKSKDSLAIQTSSKQIFAPTNLADALAFKTQNPKARVVAGATDLGVLHNKGKSFLDQVLVLNRIAALAESNDTPDGVWIGARTTLTEFENFIETAHPEFSRLLRIFASPQIKNQGTLLGNVMNGSPIGDSIPALLALNASVKLVSTEGSRLVPLTSFYKAYKVFDIKPNELATGILIPHLQGKWQSKLFKVSLRKDLDISAVTFAAVLKIENQKISEARLAMGGVGPTVIRLPDLEKQMQGQTFSQSLFQNLGSQVKNFITPISDLRASDAYRWQVAQNLFEKCYHEMNEEMTCP